MLNKKSLTIVALVVALVAGAYLLLQDKCEKAPQMESVMLQMNCLGYIQQNADSLREKICDELGKDSMCEINPEDFDEMSVVEKIVRAEFKSCVETSFKQKNFCTEDIEYIL
jgi:hypothetical protein